MTSYMFFHEVERGMRPGELSVISSGDVVIIDGVSSHRAIYPGHHKSNMLQAVREQEMRRIEEYRQHMFEKFEDEK